MTVSELIDVLLPYDSQGIKYVVTESGEDIFGIHTSDDDCDKLVLRTSEDQGLTVDELIKELMQSDGDKRVVTDRKADVCGAVYECIVHPAVYLKFYGYAAAQD